jgi:hypothetical protein
MPNAETHLAAACDLLAEPDITQAYAWLNGDGSRAAFLMGAISPDARAISGQAREATHFFTIPPADERPAPAVMCSDWPVIAVATQLSAPGAAFIAGYMTHLIMDQAWVTRVVMPGLYIAGMEWGLHHPNWRLYCILMTYLEYRAAARLPVDATQQLASAQPDGWLPFVTDHYLTEWAGRVTKLIAGGGPRRVSSSLSQSCGLDPAQMEAIVLSEAAMAREAYPSVSREQLLAFEAETARLCSDQIMTYLAGTSDRFT